MVMKENTKIIKEFYRDGMIFRTRVPVDATEPYEWDDREDTIELDAGSYYAADKAHRSILNIAQALKGWL